MLLVKEEGAVGGDVAGVAEAVAAAAAVHEGGPRLLLSLAVLQRLNQLNCNGINFVWYGYIVTPFSQSQFKLTPPYPLIGFNYYQS